MVLFLKTMFPRELTQVKEHDKKIGDQADMYKSDVNRFF